MLDVAGLHVAYESLEVLKGVSFTVNEGEIVTILGSNGAGKTTTLRTLAGLHRAGSGRIVFRGRDIAALAPHEVARHGLSLVPEGRQLFPDHTVMENLELGAYRRLKAGEAAEVARDMDEAMALFPRLRERLKQPAGLLSGGEQQMVAIARALVARPALLMMDEPSLGLAPILVRGIFETFVNLRKRGLTILLVEQMAWLALGICDRAYVLESGGIVAAGTREELMRDEKVMRAYLGKAVEA